MRYAQWRRQAAAPGRVPEFLDDTIDEHGTAALIETLLGPSPDPRGRPLTHDEARELLARYGVTVRPALPAPDREAAVAAAEKIGYPVALKTTAPISGTAPTSVVSGSISPARTRCAGRTTN